jgi:hypothetical protein
MVAYAKRAPAGSPGDISRNVIANIPPRDLSTTNPPTYYGAPVKMVANVAEAIEAGDTAANFYGVIVRQAYGVDGPPLVINPGFGAGTPDPAVEASIMTAGYILVTCNVGTPEIDAPVYMRVVAAPPLEIGDFEATPDGINNVLLSNVTFSVAGTDPSNVTEIFIK